MKREYKYPYIQVFNGIVQNIAMFDNYEEANVITRAIYGTEAIAVAYNYAVGIGDRYENGEFLVVNDDGTTTPAEYIPDDSDNINILKMQYAELTLALAEMIGGGV